MVVYLSILHRVLGEVFGQEIFHACAMSMRVWLRVRMRVSLRVRMRVSIRSRVDEGKSKEEG